jgi:hypothetical protein
MGKLYRAPWHVKGLAGCWVRAHEECNVKRLAEPYGSSWQYQCSAGVILQDGLYQVKYAFPCERHRLEYEVRHAK